jgi:hypothetical protein
MQSSDHSMQYRVSEEILAQAVGHTVVLFHPGTERFYSLNASGARIWALLAEGLDARQIIDRLAAEFEGQEPLIRGEVLAFLPQLEAEQILRREA